MRPIRTYVFKVIGALMVVITCSIHADTTSLSEIEDKSLQWFYNRDISQGSAMEVIGYGADYDLENAIVIAKGEIATQIQSAISSAITITKRRTLENFESHTTQIQNENTQMVLEEVKVIRQMYRQNKWYVAVSYENVSDIQRFIQKLYSQTQEIRDEPQNKYFTETIVGKELNRLLRRKIDVKLYWKENSLFLNYRNIYQRLSSQEYAIAELFVTHATSEHNTMHISKRSKTSGVINSDEDCLFRFGTTASKKYVSLFAVNPEGVVLVLENNVPASRQTAPYQFYKKNEYERPTMFVAVFSERSIDNSYFRIMQGDEDRKSYENGKIKFDRFIEYLADKEFVSQKMLIK